jgi:hypothetical protein
MHEKEQFIELVVARCEEDLRWLRRVPEKIRVTIYNKGSELKSGSAIPEREGTRVLQLPNIGREAHTYLAHLTECRESLAPVTVFCQGHPFDHAPDFHQCLQALSRGDEMPSPFLWYGFLDDTDDRNGRRLFVPWSKNREGKELFTGKIYEELFGKMSPELFHFRGGAQFSVTREAVLHHPVEFYRRALRVSVEVENAAHSLERFWDRIFGEAFIDPSELGSDGVRYRKPIRRLEVPVSGDLGDFTG